MHVYVCVGVSCLFRLIFPYVWGDYVCGWVFGVGGGVKGEEDARFTCRMWRVMPDVLDIDSKKCCTNWGRREGTSLTASVHMGAH